MSQDSLRGTIESLISSPVVEPATAREAVASLLTELEHGTVRAASPRGDGWEVHAWVKRGILLGFRHGVDCGSSLDAVFSFRDRDLFPARQLDAQEGLRVVPGGTTVRRGAHLGQGVVVMPPAYVNVGAFVDRDTMIDSHALVGSCAQIGRQVHLSAAVQIGGVLEPVGARPVIVEDGAFIGGGCGIYEGTRVGREAVIAPGVILTRSVLLVDLVRGALLRPETGQPLEVPARAVVVPGSRPASGEHARRWGVQLQTPVIVKYRDGETDASLVLEEALR